MKRLCLSALISLLMCLGACGGSDLGESDLSVGTETEALFVNGCWYELDVVAVWLDPGVCGGGSAVYGGVCLISGNGVQHSEDMTACGPNPPDPVSLAFMQEHLRGRCRDKAVSLGCTPQCTPPEVPPHPNSGET